MTESFQRKLTAILAADVVGYSRLMGTDESGTLSAVKAIRRDVFSPKTAQYGGRSIKLMGDGELIEFPSVVEATKAAIEIQNAMTARNQDIAEDKRIVFRIGIHIGDVIVEGDDIYGDGVNIAARLEAQAPAAGICVSRDVQNQVRDKLDVNFEDLGALEVKNIGRPVEAFIVLMDEKARAIQTEFTRANKPSRFELPKIISALVAVVAVVGVAIWLWGNGGSGSDPSRTAELASIIVLPFEDLSQDKDFGYFADGMSEDITTELARWKELKVIARNSAFTYKGKAVDVRQVAREMGVRYVLEGSVRPVGDEQIRINAQLIDGATGAHVWADRFDQTGPDILALQDKITLKLAETLGGSSGTIKTAQYRAAWEKSETSLEEYDYYLRGHDIFYRFTPDAMKEARDIWEVGLKKFPNSGLLKIKIGITHDVEARFGWVADPVASYKLSDRLLAEGMADPKLPSQGLRFGLWIRSLSAVHFHRNCASALGFINRVIEIYPYDAESLFFVGGIKAWCGQTKEAGFYIDRAVARAPLLTPGDQLFIGVVRYRQGSYQDAATHLTRAPQSPEVMATLIAAFIALGEVEQAKDMAARLSEQFPMLTTETLRAVIPDKDPSVASGILDGLKKAGWSSAL